MGIRSWLFGDSHTHDSPPDTTERREHTSSDVNSGSELREFVYLDRDSVVSLLASIEGQIKQEKIEQIGSGTEERVSGGVNAKISGIGADIGGEQVSMDDSSTEVVHNYAVQSLFDELDKHRRNDENIGRLPLRAGDEILLSDIERGDVLRVDVELETHYLYRFYKVMDYIYDNIPELISPDDEEVLQLIESMFGIEIPVSGRLLSHTLVDEEKIRLGCPYNADENQLWIVGQLNSTKLWQDIPDALFDSEEYTVFCRVQEVHQDEEWHPLSLARKIETVSPPLASVITQFMSRAAALAEREINEGQVASEILDRLKRYLEQFEENAEVNNSNNRYRDLFLQQYIADGNPLPTSSSDLTDMITFYRSYSVFLRSNQLEVSKSNESKAINYMIYEVHKSEHSQADEEPTKGVQIEVQIVAAYW